MAFELSAVLVDRRLNGATTKHIPIVILSALQLRPELKCALEAAAAEILQKPVRVAELQEVISKHLSVGVEVSTQ
jgi:CheY-like chemotaxis protein